MSSSVFKESIERYAEIGVDVEKALSTLEQVPISMHCWQGDDVGGFESPDAELGSGLAVTGNYPGKARSIDELRQDIEKAMSLVPGQHRLNLHAIYGDFSSDKADRDAIGVQHFQSWIDWCKTQKIGMDFNPTCFSHPKADDGMTLAHSDESIRQFWIEHCKCCRHIGAEIGKQLGSACVNNIWVPDGMKDSPADRTAPRQRLMASLDEILKEDYNTDHLLDAVESKLFGIGSETYVVGSHDFYLGYAIKNQILYCLDAGHFHPTESIADKISSVLQYIPEILLHVSRGVRWDSDHVVVLDDPTKAIFEEIVRGDHLSKVHIGLDFFDASINRIAAWAIGTRATQKALLLALLSPNEKLKQLEAAGDYSARLALMEDARMLPAGAVWEEFCHRNQIAGDFKWLDEVRAYESEVLSKR
ncbi:L-rhamnose isomerase [Coraliomargarita sinensis]|uniref:L-rhamnose isomerase n=1 Tax=Coraliomargarita sinensis TaxID=2174842 RepID=A0A317ZIP0_9BACT|nr:L-rhamnose isomerase [Coraliomargarita sinensis]PXA04167.1 L-rhamnose isomerase [Coraliomargarita sinensis]